MQKYLELIKTQGQLLKTCKQHFLFLITYLQKNILMNKINNYTRFRFYLFLILIEVMIKLYIYI